MSPGIGVRLADATPWIVLDVLVPGLALLLLSRVWVMVAPGLGRRLGRRALVLGLPLLLVASVAGHVAAPEAALALSDGIDFTAFVLCFPLGAAWLGALLYRLVRWLLGRRVAAPPRQLTRAAEWLRLGAVMLPVAMAVGLVQWDAARDEVKATQRRALELRTTIRALEATERKADEFARERKFLAEKLEVLHAITPRSPEIAELVSRLQAQAGAYPRRATSVLIPGARCGCGPTRRRCWSPGRRSTLSVRSGSATARPGRRWTTSSRDGHASRI